MTDEKTRALVAKAYDELAMLDLDGPTTAEGTAWGSCLREAKQSLANALEALPAPDRDAQEAIEAEATRRWGEFASHDTRQGAFERDAFVAGATWAVSRAAAPEPEWEYGTAHADDLQAVDMGYSLEGAQRRVAQWNATDPERKGIVVRAPKRVWEPLPIDVDPKPHTEHVRVTECWHMDCIEGDCDHRDEFGEPEDLSACPPAPMDVCVGCMVDRGAGADPARWEDAPLSPWPCEKTGALPVGGETE